MRHDRIPRTLDDWLPYLTRRIEILERTKQPPGTGGGGGGTGTVESVVAGTNVAVDSTDPANPVVSASTDAEVVRDTVGSALVAGSNVTITINDAGDTITISSTGGGGGGGSVDSVTAGDSTITVAGTSTDPTIAVNAIAESKVTNLTTDLAAKAPLASPALTGNPTAPTPSTGDNDTSVATTAFVALAIADLINSAPGALDTLDELAAALGDDPNFATTITNALALKAPLASPSLTGTPTAPTVAGTSDSTTKIASTAFVQAVAALKADLASPTFTGDPKAPTPSTGDNDTSVATTAFVKAQAYATLASPVLTGDPTAPTPSTGDNDTSIATTAFVKAQAYATLASPVLTGNPTAPTASVGDNDTSVATTAFVQTALPPRIALFKVAGTLTTGTGATRFYNDTGKTWTIISIRASVETAPSGGSVVVDVDKNGTTVFTTQSNRPTITTTNTTSGKVTNADITSVADGDYLTVDVDTTTAPAANLTVEIVVT